LAAGFYKAVHDWDSSRSRSLQSAEGKIGVSDLGHCSELVRRKMGGESEEATDAWAAILGTVAGDAIETAIKEAADRGDMPEVIIQSSFVVPLHVETAGRQFEFDIPAHADAIFPTLGLVIDNKGTNGLEKARRYGFDSVQKRFQRHLYGWGAYKAGLFGDMTVDDIKVGNMWHDRSAVSKEFYCRTEPFSLDVVHEAEEWLGNVVYAYLNNEEAAKEPSREFCADYCGFFDTCRALDTDAEGLISDPEVLQAVEMRLEAREHDNIAKRLKAESEALLKGVSGSTGTHIVRWVDVPGGHVEYDRAGYRKLSLAKAPRGKKA
jgi:hypothetical protein